jgi:hypothetical protein
MIQVGEQILFSKKKKKFNVFCLLHVLLFSFLVLVLCLHNFSFLSLQIFITSMDAYNIKNEKKERSTEKRKKKVCN